MAADQGFELQGFEFGNDSTMDVVVEKFEPGSAGLREQQADDPRGDSRWFGREFKTPPTWSWSLFINRDTEANALATLATLQAAWDASTVRTTPGQVVPLTYRLAGRTRRVYGRPGRCAEVYDARLQQGYIAVEADFRRADLLHYDEFAQSVTLSLVPATAGGLVSPLVSPLTSLASPAVPKTGNITVGGTAPTWATVTFTGADGATDLAVIVDETWQVGLSGPIAYDEQITVDAHPWARTAISSISGNAAGRLSGDTLLSKMQLTPGAHTLRVVGTDPTGTATVTVAWREASRSL